MPKIKEQLHVDTGVPWKSTLNKPLSAPVAVKTAPSKTLLKCKNYFVQLEARKMLYIQRKLYVDGLKYIV